MDDHHRSITPLISPVGSPNPRTPPRPGQFNIDIPSTWEELLDEDNDEVGIDNPTDSQVRNDTVFHSARDYSLREESEMDITDEPEASKTAPVSDVKSNIVLVQTTSVTLPPTVDSGSEPSQNTDSTAVSDTASVTPGKNQRRKLAKKMKALEAKNALLEQAEANIADIEPSHMDTTEPVPTSTLTKAQELEDLSSHDQLYTMEEQVTEEVVISTSPGTSPLMDTAEQSSSTTQAQPSNVLTVPQGDLHTGNKGPDEVIRQNKRSRPNDPVNDLDPLSSSVLSAVVNGQRVVAGVKHKADTVNSMLRHNDPERNQVRFLSNSVECLGDLVRALTSTLSRIRAPRPAVRSCIDDLVREAVATLLLIQPRALREAESVETSVDNMRRDLDCYLRFPQHDGNMYQQAAPPTSEVRPSSRHQNDNSDANGGTRHRHHEQRNLSPDGWERDRLHLEAPERYAQRMASPDPIPYPPQRPYSCKTDPTQWNQKLKKESPVQTRCTPQSYSELGAGPPPPPPPPPGNEKNTRKAPLKKTTDDYYAQCVREKRQAESRAQATTGSSTTSQESQAGPSGSGAQRRILTGQRRVERHFAAVPTERIQCHFCGDVPSSHYSCECNVVPDSEARILRIIEADKCMMCLRHYKHLIEECENKDVRCRWCESYNHHESLCDRRRAPRPPPPGRN